MDRGLTIKQVADLLAVRPESVYKLVHSGLLIGRRAGLTCHVRLWWAVRPFVFIRLQLCYPPLSWG